MMKPQTCPRCYRTADRLYHPKATMGPSFPSFRRQIDFTSGLDHSRSCKEIYQPLTDGYDEAVRESSEIQTSMFPSTRPSIETLASPLEDGDRNDEG